MGQAKSKGANPGDSTKSKKASKKSKKGTAATSASPLSSNDIAIQVVVEPRRKASGIALSAAQLKMMLEESVAHLPPAMLQTAKERFQIIARGENMCSIDEFLKQPEFSSHPLHRRLIEVVIDTLEKGSSSSSSSSSATATRNKRKAKNEDLILAGKRLDRLKKQQSRKNPAFYGATFLKPGSLGIKLVSDKSNTSHPVMGYLGCVVGSVFNGKFASQNGTIQEGDTLVSVNGRSVEKLHVKQTMQLIGSVGRPLKLRFKTQIGKSVGGTNRNFSFRYSVKFGEGRIGLGLKERKLQHLESKKKDQTFDCGQVYVSDIKDKTQASKKKIIEVDDTLVAVNSIDCSKLTQKKVLTLIGAERRPIILQFKRAPLKKSFFAKDNSKETKMEDDCFGVTSGLSGHRAETMSATYVTRTQAPSSSSRAVSLQAFLSALAVCSPTIDVRVKDSIAFSMYDVDGDDIVGWDDLFFIFKLVTAGNMSDIQLEVMTNRALDRFDALHDGELGLKELSEMIPIDHLLTLS